MRATDAGGLSDQHTFSLSVVSQQANHRPQFTTTPRASAVANLLYSYDADATDPDGDTMVFSLLTAPAGMTIDAETGLVRWRPTTQDVGEHTMKLRVTDALGASSDQSVTLRVRGANRYPQFDSDPITRAVVGQQYVYDVQASDPDGDRVSFSLDPAYVVGNMAIDRDSGVLTWTPTQTGTYPIRILIQDEIGYTVAGQYDLQVLATPPNDPPYFTSVPGRTVEAGQTFSWDADAADPNGQTVTFMLSENPRPASEVSFDTTTGLFSWNVPSDTTLIGQRFAFEVKASDGIDSASRRFEVLVTEANVAPVIEDVAAQNVVAGQTFRLDVRASDANDDPLRYGLDQASLDRGMRIDQDTGRISWLTDSEDIPSGQTSATYDVTVTASDGRGGTDSETFQVTVGPDQQAPTVSISLSAQQLDSGEELVLLVHATDNVAVESKSLKLVSVTLAGNTTTLNRLLQLDADGRTRLELTEDLQGVLTFEATATDTAGLTSNPASASMQVTDPNDVQGPNVSILAPLGRAVITEPVEVRATIDDPDSDVIQSWTLTATPLDGGSTRVLAQGSGERTDAVLGRFDPTVLRNGFYRVTLSATDAGGNTTVRGVTVEVHGALKLGNFSLSFVDLEIPVAGFPITITRSYDTLNADRQGDFGYGWIMDLSSTKVTIDHGDSQEMGLFGYTPFRDGTRVVITLSDGSTEGFTFFGEQSIQGFIPTSDYQPKFLPDPGVKSRLLVEPRWLRKLGNGYIDMETGRDYTPVDPFLNVGYTLRLRNGTELAINAQTGELSSVSDLNGNTVTLTDMGIAHSAGRSVEFERDHAGRITAIIDPAGNRITYEYDGAGNLIAVTDRAEATTQFIYRTDKPHYLDKVNDGLGVEITRTEYDDQGRIKRVTDAAGKTIDYTWNGESRVQRITDQLGHTTIIETDARGNVTHQKDPEGGILIWTYDGDGHLLSETIVVGLPDSPANGETNDLITTYVYNTDGDRIETIDPLGNVTRTTNHTYGQPISTTDALGNTTFNNVDEHGNITSTLDVFRNVNNFGYDDQGNPTSVRDNNGQTLATYTYNSFGEPTSSSPAVGRDIFLDYNINGDQVASWYFEGEGAAQIQVLDVTLYDESQREVGRLRGILPQGHFITQNLATATIPHQYVNWSTSTNYNAAGQVVSQTDRFGFTTEKTYDLRGQLIQTRQESIDENGNPAWLVTRSVYDAAGRAIASTNAYLEGTRDPITGTLVSYDGAGRVMDGQRVRGVVIDLVGSGELKYSVLTQPGTVVASYTMEYDNAGRVTRSTDFFGRETETTYNDAGLVVQVRKQSVNESGQTVWLLSRTLYDEFGRTTLSTEQYVEGSAAPVYATQTVYNGLGLPVQSIRLEGVQVSLVNGETTLSNGGTPLWVIRSEYDAEGQLSRSIAADGQVTTYEYDSLGQPTAVISHPLPAEEVGMSGCAPGTLVSLRTETAHDNLGQVIKERTNIRQIILPNGTSQIDDSAVQETTYEYDASGNVVKTTYTDDTFITAEYDEFDRKISETNQLGLTHTFEYDDQGALIAVVLPAIPDLLNGGQQTSPRYEYGYDAHGNKTLIRDPLGRETRFIYDANGNQLTRTLPLGFGTDGVLGTPDHGTLPEGDFTEYFEYDDLDRETLHVSFEGAVTQALYDSQSGRLSEKRFFSSLTGFNGGAEAPNEVWTYKYDAFGRTVEEKQSAGASVRTTTTSYDGEGRITRFSSLEGTLNYEYDKLGRLIRTYTGTTANAVNDTRYGYDALSRLATVEVIERDNQVLQSPELTEYQYDLMGNLDLQRQANGVVIDYVYGAMNRLNKLMNFAPDGTPENLSDNAILAEFDYDLLDDGSRSGVTETLWIDGQAKVNQITWTYDDAGRMIEEVFNSYDDMLDQTQAFSYDLAGNRLVKTTDRGNNGNIEEAVNYQYDVNDRLFTEHLDLGANGTVEVAITYGYTGTQQASKEVRENGNLTSRTTYTHDLQDRMKTVTIESYDAGGALTRRERTSYVSDAHGGRVAALFEVDANGDGTYETATRTEYLNDIQNHTGYSQTLQETVTDPGNGTVLKTVGYTLGHDVIAQTTTEYTGTVAGEQTVLTLVYDGHGSTRMLVDLTGAMATVAGVPQVFHFDAYGTLLNLLATQTATSILYSGEMFDSQVALQYLRERWYDPATGRFNRLDPFFGHLQNPLSLHKYLYAAGNPVTYIDPTGLDFSVSSLVSNISTGIRLASNTLNAVQRVYRIIDSINNAIAIFQFINNLSVFFRAFAVANGAGMPFAAAFSSALTVAFGFNPSMISQFGPAMTGAFDFIGNRWHNLRTRIRQRTGEMAAAVAADLRLQATIASHAMRKQEIALLLDFPSPPFPTPWRTIRLPIITLPGNNKVRLQSDGRQGRLFAIGAEIFGRRATHNLPIIRIDYQDFHRRTYLYDPHYQVSDNPDPHPI